MDHLGVVKLISSADLQWLEQLECLWAELCLLSLYVKVREYCNKVRINLDIICGQR